MKAIMVFDKDDFGDEEKFNVYYTAIKYLKRKGFTIKTSNYAQMEMVDLSTATSEEIEEIANTIKEAETK